MTVVLAISLVQPATLDQHPLHPLGRLGSLYALSQALSSHPASKRVGSYVNLRSLLAHTDRMIGRYLETIVTPHVLGPALLIQVGCYSCLRPLRAL